jgi:hypothetical protein
VTCRTPARDDGIAPIRIGIVGAASVAALLGLALSAFRLGLRDGVHPARLFPLPVTALLRLVAFCFPFLALVGLPLTGYIAAAGAVVRPLRAGGIAAATAAAVSCGAALVLRAWTGGWNEPVREYLPHLLWSAWLAGTAAGLIMIGAVVGASRHRVAR